jgi:hypothetical protein
MTRPTTSSKTRETISTQPGDNSGAQSLIEVSMAWMDPLYDDDLHLLRYPHDAEQHMVRESLWYAHGHDFCLGPIAAFSAVAIPDQVKKHFVSFEKTRSLSQRISSKPLRKVACNRLTLYLETSCQLQENTNSLTIKLPNDSGEHTLSITCQVNE